MVSNSDLMHSPALLTALANMYAKCHNMQAATVQAEASIKCFNDMQSQGLTPTESYIIGALGAVALLCDYDLGKRIHTQLLDSGMHVSLTVQIALINMYSKCGELQPAVATFEDILKSHSHVPRMVWTNMINGFGKNGTMIINCANMGGEGAQALACFHKMEASGCSPNSVTFVALLSALSHSCKFSLSI